MILSRYITNQEISVKKPVWFMRQAGRYLPEFMEIRKQNQDFIKLCLNTKLATEITLQPIKRYNLDAAIIFSDILMVPHALGQKVTFIKDHGPKLTYFETGKFSRSPDEMCKILEPVYSAINLTRNQLNKDKSLIGFIGAPWTLGVYMMNLKEDKNTLNNEKFYTELNLIRFNLERLVNILFAHIEKQYQAGADVIQMFDSWAGLIPEKYVKELCFEPSKKIRDFCKSKNIPLICFPKGIGKKYKDFIEYVKPDCVNIDYELDPVWARENLKDTCIQGGLDPKKLLGDEKLLLTEVKNYLDIFKNQRYIFNLGHGILPETKPETVEKIVKIVRDY